MGVQGIILHQFIEKEEIVQWPEVFNTVHFLYKLFLQIILVDLHSAEYEKQRLYMKLVEDPFSFLVEGILLVSRNKTLHK